MGSQAQVGIFSQYLPGSKLYYKEIDGVRCGRNPQDPQSVEWSIIKCDNGVNHYLIQHPQTTRYLSTQNCDAKITTTNCANGDDSVWLIPDVTGQLTTIRNLANTRYLNASEVDDVPTTQPGEQNWEIKAPK